MEGYGEFQSRREADAGRHATAVEKGVAERIGLELAANASAAGDAREALTPLEPRLTPTVMKSLRLLVSELVTNSVRHARAVGEGRVGLDIWLAERSLRVEVTDRGSGFEPLPRRPGQSKAGGWGLYLVDRLADRWGVAQTGINRVWFEIDHADAVGERSPAAG
ncbi:MAG: hypothetical protein NVSMB25_12960 [Thermoleophilaceae bacterium]